MKADARLRFQYEEKHLAPHGLLYFVDCEIQCVYFKNGKAVYNLGGRCAWYSMRRCSARRTGRLTGIWTWIGTYPGTREVSGASLRRLEDAQPAYSWTRDANNKANWDEI